MWFGLYNIFTKFAKYIMHLLIIIIRIFVIVYFDDITVYSDNLKNYVQHNTKVLKIIKKKELTLKITKYKFYQKKIELLGERISEFFKQILEEKL